MNTRHKDRLDYKLMYKTGEKLEKVSDTDINNLVSKLEDITVMSQAKASDNVKSYKKIVSEISDYIELNDLNDMEDIEL